MNLAAATLAASNPVDHVVNKPQWVGDLFGMQGVWLWSAHVGNLVLAGIITVLLLAWAASKIRTGPASLGTDRFITTSPVAHAIEVVIVYMRESAVRPLLGARTDRFLPFLLTMFFFILISNLLGLTPFTDLFHLSDRFTGGHTAGLVGTTATQNIFVTAALAIIAGVVINVAGVRELGLGGFLKHLTAGTKPVLWPLMIPIEIIGSLVRPVALALRLFANMTAGHILMAVLFSFAVSGLGLLTKGGLGVVMGGAITAISIVAAIAIYFLELFVAFLQAFVFTFLTTVFISQLSHHHDHEHDGAHDHERAHA